MVVCVLWNGNYRTGYVASYSSVGVMSCGSHFYRNGVEVGECKYCTEGIKFVIRRLIANIARRDAHGLVVPTYSKCKLVFKVDYYNRS